GGEPHGRAHAATSAFMTCARSTAGFVRTSTTETIAAANASPAARRSAACSPLTNCCAASARDLVGCWYESRIAPMIAIPSEPPTWRKLFNTPEPTPALSTGRSEERRVGKEWRGGWAEDE